MKRKIVSLVASSNSREQLLNLGGQSSVAASAHPAPVNSTKGVRALVLNASASARLDPTGDITLTTKASPYPEELGIGAQGKQTLPDSPSGQ